MSSAIIGFGAIGQALARKNIQVAVASRRTPEAIAPQAKAIGPTVTASSLQDALKAQIVILWACVTWRPLRVRNRKASL